MLTGFLPVEERAVGLKHVFNVWGRSIVCDANSLPCSIVSQGRELLAAPMRLVGIEDGRSITWGDDYAENESASFIQKRCDEEVTLCGAMQSPRFIVDTTFTVHFDGAIDCCLKVMPCGLTVAQLYGLDSEEKLKYSLEQLWLEIPLKKEIARFYNIYPNSVIQLADGTNMPKDELSGGGLIPEQDAGVPFLPTLWLGNDELGLGWNAESDQHWQPANPDRAIELVHEKDALILRIHLLDSHPILWSQPPENGQYAYTPITFRFSLMPTPVKQFPKEPYLLNGLHLDCFVKIKGDYAPFLAKNNAYDLMKESGVTTLILHEKWNKSQNYTELSEYTQQQLREIVTECHKRGIKVLPYFGYELSSMAPDWEELEAGSARVINNSINGGWYRVPYQRAYICCYNSPYQEKWLQGIAKLMDDFHVDGVYLDSTINTRSCSNQKHGCGYLDETGKLHPTYPVAAIRRLFQKLYSIVHSRGGIINVHSQGCINCLALPYIDLSWYGENMQFKYISGKYDDMPLDYFRAQYCGRSIGVPVEYIAYEKLPVWSFENAVAMSCIHGIFPRPNGIEHPLQVMSPIWDILAHFPIGQSEWCPYWNNQAHASDSRIKISYYRHVNPLGQSELLAFCANTTHNAIENVSLFFEDNASCKQHILNASNKDSTIFEGYGYKIIYIQLY